MGVYWVVEEVQMHQKYIGKTKQNRWKTKRRARKIRTTGGNGSTTAVGLTTVRLWLPPRAVVPAGGGGPLFPVHCVLGSFGVSPWAAGFAFSWVFWASLQAFFDPHGPHFISLDSSQTFLPKSWLEL